LELLLQYKCTKPVSLYSSMNPLGKLLIGGKKEKKKTISHLKHNFAFNMLLTVSPL